MRYSADHRDRTRQRLLQAAATIIRSDGLDRMTIGAVSKRLKMTHGGFYLHFASREDLVEQAVIDMFDTHHSALLAETASAESKKSLAHFVDVYLSIEHRNRPQTGCPIPILAGEHGRLPKAAREHFTHAVRRFTCNIARHLHWIGADDCDARAASVVAEMIGAVAVARVYSDEREAKAILSAAKRSVRDKLSLNT